VITTESSLSAAEPAESQSTAEVSEDGEKMDTSPACGQRQVNVEVLVEDSQMGAPSSPVRVVDTQESMFVDDTPPHGKSSDAAAGDSDATQSTSACDVGVFIADTCDADSFLSNEVSQQTVVHIDANETVTSVTSLDVSDATTQLPASNVKEMSELAVSIETASSVRSSKPSDAFIIDSETLLTDVQSTAMCTDNMNKISSEDTSHTQPNVIDDTQDNLAGCLDYAQYSVVDHTQAGSTDHTQLTLDGSQNSAGSYLADTELDEIQASSENTDNVVVVTAAEDDSPVPEVTRSHDADTCLSDTQRVMTKKDDDDDDVKSRQSMSSSSIGFQRHRRRGRPKALDSKDAIHATLQGRVTRSVAETRPTRLNLRTRSVRRLTDKLVSVGAKKVDGITSQPTAVRKRGRPRGSKSRSPEVTNGQGQLEVHSRVPCRTVSRRRCKSLWMKVAAAETDIAAASIENESQESQAVSDVHTSKSSVEVDSDAAELRSDIDVRQTDEATAFEDSMKSVSDEEVTVCTEKLHDDQCVDETVDVNTDVELVTGEVPVSESSGKPGSGSSSGQDMTVAEDHVSCDKPESDINLSRETADGENDVAESCGKPESDVNLSQELMVNEDSEVELSGELTGEEQTSSGPSQPSLTLDVIAKDNQVDTASTNAIVSSNVSASELTINDVVVPSSVSAPSADDDAAVDMEDSEPAPGTDNVEEEDSKMRMAVEKSTPSPDVGGECQWKVPTSSVARAQPAPPETPTSIPRRRFTSRGSLMLERSMQLRQSAASSPPVR